MLLLFLMAIVSDNFIHGIKTSFQNVFLVFRTQTLGQPVSNFNSLYSGVIFFKKLF